MHDQIRQAQEIRAELCRSRGLDPSSCCGMPSTCDRCMKPTAGGHVQHMAELIAERDALKAALDYERSAANALRLALDVAQGAPRTDMAREALARAAAARVPLTPAASDVLAERRRQIEIEGWTPQHDDIEHLPDELALAACCYCMADKDDAPPAVWPWDWGWWKPKDRRRNMIKAAALLLAEIERMDRKVDAQKGGAA
jgi:hypothetical protein